MKRHQLGRRVLACVLVISMILGMSATAFASVEDNFTGNVINVVSLGASNVNGYGLDGYLPAGTSAENKNTANVFGYRRCPEGSYVDLVCEALEGKGYTVNPSQLAISSMRVEELRVLLDENYYGDAYTAWRFTGPGKWFENAAVTGGLDALRADYAASIADAELITVDIGVNNFGVYLSNQLASGGTAYDDDLSLVDPELAEEYNNAKAYVYELINEHAGEYAEAVSGLDFVIDAMAYALAGFCVNYDIVMEKIYELNPDATVVAVSIQNLMEGLEATIPGVDGTVPFGELFGALVDAANLYISVGSPYSNKYLFADVSQNGRVEFFLDQLLAYDGNPASLDKDMKDCFDVYDDDLMISARVDGIARNYLASLLTPYFATLSTIYNETETEALLNAIFEDEEDNFAIAKEAEPSVADALADVIADYNILKPLVLNVAYDVVAEIMQLGATNNVLDLTTVIAGGYGLIEDGLLEAIEAEVMTAIEEVVADPSYEYSIDDAFFANIASVAGVSEELVNTVATLGIRTSIGNSFYGHPNRAGHAEIAEAIIDALENDITGLDALLKRLDLTEEYEDAVDYVSYIEAEVRRIIDFVQNATYEEKEALVKDIIADLKEEFGITAEDEEAAKEIIDEIKDIIDVVQNGTYEEKEAVFKAYFELLIAELGITEEAMITEFVTIAVEIIDIIKNTSEEDVKDAIDEYLESVKAKLGLEFAKLGHKHFEGSNYVAIGGDTLFGTGITRQDKLYSQLVSEALSLENGVTVAQERLLATGIAELVMNNAQNIAAADLITYQLDASAFVNALFSEEAVEWSKYIDPEVSALFNVVLEEATEILTADWAAYANAEIDEVLAAVIPQVQPVVAEYIAKAEDAVAEYITIDLLDEAKIDSLIAQGIICVREAIDFVAAKKDGAYAEAVATIEGIDDMIINYAEKLAYACVAYAMDTVKAIETIQTINPDATVLVVGMYNPLVGLEIVVNGETIDAGEIFENVINVTNAFYYTYAAINGKIAFVDVADTEINGFDAAIQVSDLDALITLLPNLLRNIDNNMHATAAGHEYIKDQIVKALTCDFSEDWEEYDAECHAKICSICGYEILKAHELSDWASADKNNHERECSVCGYTETEAHELSDWASVDKNNHERECSVCEYTETEAHNFTGKTCDDCGYKKKTTNSVSTGGGSTTPKMKFDDVKKGDWFYDYVKTLFEKGLMKGISETEFAPDATLTRGMFVTILHRIEREPVAENGANFADIAEGQYYTNAVKWASKNGIVKGVSETEFAPDAEVTREQMAAMISRYAEYKKLKVAEKVDAAYTDADEIAEYAKDAVNVANKLGILIGNADGSFAPKNNATRAEAATLFARLLGVIGK